jgi:hypothetical protein
VQKIAKKRKRVRKSVKGKEIGQRRSARLNVRMLDVEENKGERRI